MDKTFFYIVGGQQVHYDNIMRSIRSLRQFDKKSKIMIFEVGDKLKTTADYIVINQPNIIDLNHKGKIGFKFWKQKYVAALYVNTEYGIYMDSDTVVVNDNFDELLTKIGDKVGSAQHFWVPTIGEFHNKAVPPQNRQSFNSVISRLGCSNDTPLFAGGIFMFKNTPIIKNIMNDTLYVYDDVYSVDSSYITGLTDEIFFSGILNKYNAAYRLNGALNHCCMGDSLMPVKYENGLLYGRNTWESEWEKITLFHCDPTRRNPAKDYNGIVQQQIQKAWSV